MSEDVTVVTIATLYESLSKIVGDIADGYITQDVGRKKLDSLKKKCDEAGIPFVPPDDIMKAFSKAKQNPNIAVNDFESESSSEYYEESSDE